MVSNIDKFSVALVGIGGYGGAYTRELLDESAAHKIRFAAAIDPYPAACPFLSEIQQAGVPVYSTLADFYMEGFADLVVVSAPIHDHAPLTCLALKHGSHVLCEKPLCATIDEAQQMLDAQAEVGKIVAIGYQWSFSNPIQTLKADVLAGVFGKPKQLKTIIFWPRDTAYFTRNTWAGRIQTQDEHKVFDSPVNNATAHYLHNAFYILGDFSFYQRLAG